MPTPIPACCAALAEKERAMISDRTRKAWAALKDLLDVSAFPGGDGKVDYFYVKARTP